MSSHPGSTIEDAIELALCLKKNNYAPEQVQDYYPTPGTASTVMYYTGINPLTMKNVYVATDYHEKQLQRALLQYNRPQNAALVREALTRAGRTDLIGYGKECLVRPAGGAPHAEDKKAPAKSNGTRGAKTKTKASSARDTSRGTSPKQKRGFQKGSSPHARKPAQRKKG